MIGLAGPELAGFVARPSTWRGCAHVGLEWAWIVLAASIAHAARSPWVTALAWLVIGARQHALTALAHEAAHGRLAARRWNLVLAETCAAWPLLLSVRGYRRTHLAHHAHLGTPDDPDWARNRPDRWGKPRPVLRRLQHLVGLESRQRALTGLFFAGRPSTAADRKWLFARAVYGVAALALITHFGAWPLVIRFWCVPWLFVFLPLMRLRGIAEHWAVAATGPLDDTRTLLLSPLVRWLFLPKNMGYHLEHHLYPAVPFQALPRLHQRLATAAEYRANAHVTHGLQPLFEELARFRRMPRADGLT